MFIEQNKRCAKIVVLNFMGKFYFKTPNSNNSPICWLGSQFLESFSLLNIYYFLKSSLVKFSLINYFPIKLDKFCWILAIKINTSIIGEPSRNFQRSKRESGLKEKFWWTSIFKTSLILKKKIVYPVFLVLISLKN